MFRQFRFQSHLVQVNTLTRIIKQPSSVALQSVPFEVDSTASQRLKNILKSDGECLRVAVQSGGCHGYQYTYDIVPLKSVTSHDVLLEKEGVHVVLDESSLDLVKGATLIHEASLMGNSFRVKNPMAASGCSCGVSFDVK